MDPRTKGMLGRTGLAFAALGAVLALSAATFNAGTDGTTGAVVKYDPLPESSGGFGANISGLGSAYLARTGPGLWVARTLQSGFGITLTNPGGQLGNTTISATLLASGSAAGLTSDPVYSLAAFAAIPQMTVALVTSGGKVFCVFSGSFDLQNFDSWDVALFADGVEVSNTRRHVQFNGASGILGLFPGAIDGAVAGVQALMAATAGAHSYEARWSRSAGQAKANGTQRRMDCMEMHN